MFEGQWMNKNIPDEMNRNELMNKEIFFDDRKEHSYSHEKLIWLSRWIGQDYTDIKKKRIQFLKKIWNQYYFHPFISVKEATQKIKEDREIYLISLSSTLPGTIRISCWRDGVKHHRVNLETYHENGIMEKIDYDLNRLELVIDKIIQIYCKNIKYAVYTKIIGDDINE